MSEDKNLKGNNEENLNENIENSQEIIETNTIQEDSDKESNSELEKSSIKDKLKNNKAKNIIIVAIVGAICLGAGFSYGKEQGRKLPATAKHYSSNKVIAKIGDTKITGENLQKKMDPLFYLNGKEALTEDEITAAEASMIDYITTTEVLYLEGKAEKIEVKDDDVEDQYTNLMSSITEKFSMTEEEFLKQFNLTKDYVKKELEKELIATKYIGQASDVSDKEAKNYYDKNKEEFLQVRASHILLKTVDDENNPLSDDKKKENKAKAEEALKKVKAGEDFATIAKEYSQDGSASNGGDLDFFSKSEMVEPFANAAFDLKVGEISDKLVESQFGYHIIKKTDEKQQEFDDIKEDLKYRLSYEKQSNILDNLIEKYSVEVNEEK